MRKWPQTGKLALMTHSTRGGSRVPVFSLGERIRKVRDDLGLSQQQFADQLGVDRKTVSNWESEKNRPRRRDLMMISSVADVNLAWLTGDSEEEASRDNCRYDDRVAA